MAFMKTDNFNPCETRFFFHPKYNALLSNFQFTLETKLPLKTTWSSGRKEMGVLFLVGLGGVGGGEGRRGCVLKINSWSYTNRSRRHYELYCEYC